MGIFSLLDNDGYRPILTKCYWLRFLGCFLTCFLANLPAFGQDLQELNVGRENKQLLFFDKDFEYEKSSLKINWEAIKIEEEIIQSKKPIKLLTEQSPVKYSSPVEITGSKIILTEPTIRPINISVYSESSADFKKIDTKSGLPVTAIEGISFDGQDNLWAISRDELLKLGCDYSEEFNFIQGLPDIDPTSIAEWNGELFIGTFGQGLIHINGREVNFYKKKGGLLSNHIIEVEATEEYVYISTYDRGLIRINVQDKTAEQLMPFEEFTRFKSIHSNNNDLWFIDPNEQIGQINSSGQIVKFTIDGEKLPLQVCGAEEAYFLLKDKGIIYKNADESWIVESPLFQDVKSIFCSKEGLLKVITSSHLIEMDSGIIVNSIPTTTFSKNKISDIKEDRFSNLWVSFRNGGLVLSNPSSFSLYDIPEKLLSEKSNFLFIDNEGNTYFEYAKGGLIKRTNTGNLYKFSHPLMRNITAAVNFQEELYITSFNGLFALNENSSTHYTFDESGANSLTNVSVAGDRLILNNYNFSFSYFDGNSFRHIKGLSTLTHSAYFDQGDTLWIANEDKGISCITEDSLINFNEENGFPAHRVNFISGDGKGALLIGTNKGLFYHYKSRFYRVKLENYDSYNFLSATYNSKSRTFWTATSNELYNLNFDSLRVTIQTYNHTDFNFVNHINANTLANFEDILIFKSGQKIIQKQLALQKESILDPKLSIKKISLNNREESIDKLQELGLIDYEGLDQQFLPVNLTVSQEHHSLVFLFDINYWGKEDKLNYYYRLIGQSEEWIGPLKGREIRFNKLTYGTYTLELKVTNENNVKIEPLNFSFEVESYFYQESYFAILVGLIVLVLSYILLKTFTDFTVRTIDSYTSLSSLIKKLRIVAILSMILFPGVSFYESEVLGLFKANWPINIGITIAAVLALIFSFYKNVTARLVNNGLHILYSIVYVLMVYLTFESGLNVTLGVETALMILFSKVIYVKLRPQLVFFLLVFAVNITFLSLFPGETVNQNIYMSASTQCVLVVAAVLLVEGKSISNLTFSRKILKSNSLFVVVIDRKGNVVYVSDYLLERTNTVESDFLGEGWWEYNQIYGEERAKEIAAIQEIVNNEKSKQYTDKLKAKGEFISVEWQGSSLEKEFVILIGRDITEQKKMMKEMKKLSLVATSVTNGIVITDKDNKAEWINKPFLDMLGVDSQELLGQDIMGRIAPLNLATKSILKSSEQLDPNHNQTLVFNSELNNQLYCLVTTSNIYEEGESIQKVQVWTDISEQKKYEQQYKEVINNAFDNIYTANYKGEFLYVNNAFLENMGCEESEIIGRHFSETIHPDHKVDVIRFYQKQFEERTPVTYNEVLIKRPDGKELWVGQNVRLVFDPLDNQKIIQLHVVARDITEKKENQEELKRLSAVARRTTNIVMIFDDLFRLEWVNKAFTSVFDYEPEEVIGRIPDFLLGEETDKEAIRDFREKLSNHERVETELLNYDKNGNTKWIEISMDPIFDEDGNFLNYISVESDISKRKSQEALIALQHEDIIKSIQYSTRIQGAILPSEEDVERIHPNTFVIYKPKDIISGDFYMIESLLSRDNQKIDLFIVGDCTGHGVPGAMLSILCSSILKEASVDRLVNSPSQALDFAKNKLYSFFRQHGGETIYDGMDVCFCELNHRTRELSFSGANRPLYLLRGEEVIEYKGDRLSVGFSRIEQNFTTQKIKLQRGDTVYLFSDGIVDQFGGEKEKKFMSKRLKSLILSVRHESMKKQKEIIETELAEWQGSMDQTDDICLMGVRF